MSESSWLSDDDQPHDLEVEMMCLGAMMLDYRACYQAVGGIDPRAFFSPAHRTICKAMAALFKQGVAPGLVTMKDQLQTDGALDDVGGTAYLIQLMDAPENVNYFSHYWAILVRKWRARGLAFLSNKLARAALDGDEAQVRRLQKEIQEIDHITHPGTPIAPLFDPYAAQDLRGVSTGFPELDTVLDHGGYPSGHMSLVMAPTNGGKTTVMLQSVYELLARRDHADPYADGEEVRVAFVSGEMSFDELARKLVRMRCGWTRPPGNLETRAEYDEAVKWLNHSSLEVFDLQGRRGGIRYLEEAIAWLSVTHRAKPLQIAFLDYIQLFELKDFKGKRFDEVGRMSAMIINCAQDLKIPIVVGSQVSYNAAGQFQTRDGRQIEDDAALILEITPSKDGKELIEGQSDIYMRKVRFGERAKTRRMFDTYRRMLVPMS